MRVAVLSSQHTIPVTYDGVEQSAFADWPRHIKIMGRQNRKEGVLSNEPTPTVWRMVPQHIWVPVDSFIASYRPGVATQTRPLQLPLYGTRYGGEAGPFWLPIESYYSIRHPN